MVIFVEACFSGSYFTKLQDWNVYAMTASNKYLTSKADFCFEDAKLTKTITDQDSCLSDLFSYNWMSKVE